MSRAELSPEAEEITCGCGSTCFYATSLCNFTHCMHCGEAAEEEHAECYASPGMMAAEWDGAYTVRHVKPGFDTCRRCGEELEAEG